MNIQITGTDHPYSDFSIIVYFNGCAHNCKGCHNRGLQKYKQPSDLDELTTKIINLAQLTGCDTIVLSGGDPLYPANLSVTKYLLQTLTCYRFCIYTGYSIEHALSLELGQFELIKCGQYVSSLAQTPGKTETEFRLASRNQDFFDSNGKVLSVDGVLPLPERR